MSRPPFRLLLITDRKLGGVPLADAVAEALAAALPGSTAIQLREKDLDAQALFELAKTLLPLCRARGASLLVNDRIDVALALDLDGVHLPQASFSAGDARRLLGPSKLLGVSCHSPAEVETARNGGANYATFGPIFDTPTKREFGPPVGLDALKHATTLGLPLFALGGMVAGNASDAVLNGAAGVAAIGGWLGQYAAGSAVKRLLAGLEVE